MKQAHDSFTPGKSLPSNSSIRAAGEETWEGEIKEKKTTKNQQKNKFILFRSDKSILK